MSPLAYTLWLLIGAGTFTDVGAFATKRECLAVLEEFEKDRQQRLIGRNFSLTIDGYCIQASTVIIGDKP
jgi:hypothetical protein